MNLSEVKFTLELMEEQYRNRLDELANQVRQHMIIPFCDRTGYKFSAGMGSWSFHKGDKMLSSSMEWFNDKEIKAIPKKLLASLTAETLYNNDFGSLIEDYDPKEPT